MSITRACTLGVAALVLAVASAVATTAQSPTAPSASPPGEAAGSPVPGSAASPISLPDGNLDAGTTYFMDGSWGASSPRLIFTVPATGWSGGGYNLRKGTFSPTAEDPSANSMTVAMTPWKVANLYADPCHWRSGGLLDPPVGPTVDDLATALVQQAGGTRSTVSDVALGGYTGKKVELSWPDGLDVATCDIWGGGVRVYGRWLESPDGTGGHSFGNGQRNTVYILDLDGQRAVIDTLSMPIASQADLAELEALVASIRFEPSAPRPSPSV